MATRARHKVKPPRKGIHGGGEDFTVVWPELRDSFKQVHRKAASSLSYEQLYRKGYSLVLKKNGAQLYDGMAGLEEEWLREEVMSEITAVLTPSSFASIVSEVGSSGRSENEKRAARELVLRTVKDQWTDYQTTAGMLADVLMYLDRVYCKDHKVASVYSQSMNLFRRDVLDASAGDQITVLTQLTMIILAQIEMERNGEIIDKHLIKNCVYMLEGLYVDELEREEDRLYNCSFELEFLQSSRDFYRREAERMLGEADAGAYCRQTRKRINEEEDRCRSTLSEGTAPKIVKVVEDELIKNRIGDLIASDRGVSFMVDNDLFEELELIYDLNKRVDEQKQELKKALSKKVFQAGTDVNNAALAASQAPPPPPQATSTETGKPQAAAPVNLQTMAALKWVDDVLRLKDKYDEIWKRAFESDRQIQTALTRSFSDFVNAASFPRGSEYISLFIDENMKKGIKGKTEEEIDAVLDKAITLLRYVQDKDMFEVYYKKHLSRRLIMSKSISNEVEKQMISRMKIELGNNFTIKMEAMFKDMNVSEDLTNGYRKKVAGLGEADQQRVDLGITVLTSGTWPLESSTNAENEGHPRPLCIFPPEIDRIKTGFERYYAEKHSGRKLTWLAHMGTADIKAVFSKVPTKDGFRERKHELNVSTYAMVVLVLFNDPLIQSLSFEEIQAKTNIPEGDLMRTLQAVAVAPKTRILTKEPMSKDVKTTDRFSFNEGFTSKFIKVKVGVVAAGNKVENDRERRDTEQKNESSRGFMVEAAIVRIMKQRKDLDHQQLVVETISQLANQFKPEVGMIKRKIESLIEREYLERNEDLAKPAYRYLA